MQLPLEQRSALRASKEMRPQWPQNEKSTRAIQTPKGRSTTRAIQTPKGQSTTKAIQKPKGGHHATAHHQRAESRSGLQLIYSMIRTLIGCQGSVPKSKRLKEKTALEYRVGTCWVCYLNALHAPSRCLLCTQSCACSAAKRRQ